MQYAKIKPGTPAWEKMHLLMTFRHKWEEHQAEIEEFLGFPMKGNLYYNTDHLVIERRKVKPEWVDQFRKNSTPAQTKVNSTLGTSWRVLCRKLGLDVHYSLDFCLITGLTSGTFTAYEVNGMYFLEWDGNKPLADCDWAEVIDEAAFLRLKAQWAEQRDGRKQPEAEQPIVEVVERRYSLRDMTVTAVQYRKNQGLEDGFAVYETAYPEEGHMVLPPDEVDTTFHTILQGAVLAPDWVDINEGDWILMFSDGKKEVWSDERFRQFFVAKEE